MMGDNDDPQREGVQEAIDALEQYLNGQDESGLSKALDALDATANNELREFIRTIRENAKIDRKYDFTVIADCADKYADDLEQVVDDTESE